MPTYEAVLDTELDPLARATMAAWDGEPSALRLVTSQAQPRETLYNVQEVRPLARPTLATITPCNVIGIRRYANRRPIRPTA